MKTIILKKEEIYQGSLLLVNRQYPLREDCSREKLIRAFPQQPEILLERTCAGKLQQVLSEICAGEGIVGVSGFRPWEEQEEIFRDSLKENGREFTETYVALPGHSEHQTGLAIDLALNGPEIDFICPDFPDDGICKKFRRAAVLRGFVERYPAGRERVTGIGAEPWHFRYVGEPHGQLMQEKQLVLEEYIPWLKQFLWEENPLQTKQETGVPGELRAAEYGSHKKQYRIGFIPCLGDSTAVRIPDGWQAVCSGNNVDGFVVTAVLSTEQTSGIY